MKLYSNDLLLLLSLLTANPQMDQWRVLWGDTVESKIDVIDAIVDDENSKLDVIEARINELTPTLLDSSNISGSTITISAAGNYRLEEDVIANITLNGSASCATLDLNNRSVVGVLTVIGDQCKVHNGSFFPPAPSVSNQNATFIHVTADRSILENLAIICSDSTGVATAGMRGIFLDGQHAQILNCIIVTGSASDGNGSTTTGADGGVGIRVRAGSTYARIKNCVFSTGNGGSAPGAGGVGGDGGIGIWCERSDYTEIIGCTILGTGNGGDGDAGSGTGGAGGTGLLLGSSSFDLSVRDCVIKNSGQGGAGATPGAGGQGIHNQVPSGTLKSIVLSNKAHNIAGINFNLNNAGTEQGVGITPYPPTTTAINAYANTYVS